LRGATSGATVDARARCFEAPTVVEMIYPGSSLRQEVSARASSISWSISRRTRRRHWAVWTFRSSFTSSCFAWRKLFSFR